MTNREHISTWPIAGFAARAAILAGLWWLIAQGRADAWLIGLPVVAAAALASIHTGGHAVRRLSLAGLLMFVALFLRESIRGGIDVARRTLGPGLHVQPGFVKYRVRIDDPAARVLLINCIGLLPGTLAAGIDGDIAELHLLDTRDNPEPQLLQLEQAVARLFRLKPVPAND
jgi:multicomponent Na+:H+ antiporter subunit E